MRKRQIPRIALADLSDMCVFIGEHITKKPPAEELKYYLALMDVYEDYFFSEQWPQEYDFKIATTFTDADQTFLFANEEELLIRLDTVCLKKNIYLNGFMGFYGMFWTRQAYHEQFVRPKLIPVGEAFQKHAESSDDAQEVLEKLKSEFHDAAFIHDGLVDYREINYPDKQKDKLLAKILEAIHTMEGLPECDEYMCKLQRENLHKPPSPYAS